MTVLDTPIPKITTRPPTTKAAESTSMSFSGLESLQKGLIHTDISPATARWMVGLFLAALAFVPLGQLGYELLRHKHVQELDVLRPPKNVAWRANEGRIHHTARVIKICFSKDNFANYEENLKENSIFRHVIQPRMQLVMSKYFCFGNGGAIVARENLRPNGWLFYQLGVDYLAAGDAGQSRHQAS